MEQLSKKKGVKLVKEILTDGESRMKKAIAVLGREFATVRTGRASPALLEHVMVDYYGTKTPLPHLATISVPEPQLLLIQPWDKTIINQIEKAIFQSDLGLTPSSDGNVIRLPFPPLTEERRRELVKVIKKMSEEGKVAIRNIRREIKEKLEKLEEASEISEDELRRSEEELQKLTDEYINEINQMVERKEREIMEI